MTVENLRTYPSPQKMALTMAPSLLCALGLALAFPAIGAEQDWAMCGGGFALPDSPTIEGDSDPEAIHVAADSADLSEGGSSILTGNVHVLKGTQKVTADQIIYDKPSETLDGTGQVKFWDEGLFLTGDHAKIELNTDLVVVDNASFMSLAEHARGEASRARIIGNEFIHVEDVRYTTCDPGNSNWEMIASEINLDKVNEVGTARNVRVEFFGVPVFYSPILSFPLSDKRKSGFLSPSFRFSGPAGAETTIPYYLNIAPDRDATIATRAMLDRGVQLQGEFRYLSRWGNGQVGAEFLPSDNKFKKDRSALQFQHSGNLTSRLYSDVNLNWASDKEYFEDLGTNLAIASQTHLERRGDLIYNGDRFWALARVQDFQTIDRTIAGSDRPYERLPQLLAATSLPERNRRLNYGLRGEFVSFDRQSSVTGTRVDFQPWVSFPMRTGASFLVPRLEVQHTRYSLDHTVAGTDDSPSRTIPRFSVDGGMFFERDGMFSDKAFVQTLEPRVYYLFVPFDNQTALPVFDTGEYTFNFAQLFRPDRFAGADRVGDAHQITLALTSRLLDDSGSELMRASIGQIRYFRDRKVTLPGVVRDTGRSSDLVAEVEATLTENWRVAGALQWDANDNETDKNSVTVRYQPDSQRVINAGYRFVRGTSEQLDLSLAWPVTHGWKAVGRFNYALPDRQILETFAGFEYEGCCWAFRTVARRYLSDSRGSHSNAIFMQLELKGLAGVGQQAVDFLQRSIPGYENEF